MPWPIEIKPLKPPPVGGPRISALFCFRHDVHLVPDLIVNLQAFVHDCIIWDDRGSHQEHSNEPQRRNALLRAARDNGTDWVLAVDPDERFESRLGAEMARLTGPDAAKTVWNFNVREMFAPNAWRSDGIWASKAHIRLFSMAAVQGELRRPLHGLWLDVPPDYKVRPCGVDIYHFHHLSPQRDQARRDSYAGHDPERFYNSIGYDYLADRRGMELQEIAPTRGYQPPWKAEVPVERPKPDRALQPDPLESSLRFMQAALRRKGFGQALSRAQDLAEAHPEDADLAEVSRILAAGAGDGRQAPTPDLWRRWIKGPATLHEGAQNGQGQLSVIVLSFRADPETRATLKALLRQAQDCEIVVVNSGGGDILSLLQDMLPRIRLIDVEEPLFVGAARNIGLDASGGPWVSFLASDCPPSEGWIKARLERHAAGATSVATAVSPDKPGSVIAAITWQWRFYARDPGVDPDRASLFGRSFHRKVFQQLGYFAPGLRQAEDHEFNLRVDGLWRTVWAPEICVVHKDPVSLRALFRDAQARGLRAYPPAGVSWSQFKQRNKNKITREQEPVLPAAMRPKGWRQWLMVWAKRQYAKAYARGFAKVLANRHQAAAWANQAGRLLAESDPRALDLARRAVQAEAQCESFWLLLAKCEAALAQDRAAALAACKMALSLRPTLEAAIEAALGCAGDPLQALALATDAVTMVPAVPAIRLLAADAAEKAGQDALALAHLRHALAFDPASPAVHQRLAGLHRKMGNARLASCRDHSLDRLQKPICDYH